MIGLKKTSRFTEIAGLLICASVMLLAPMMVRAQGSSIWGQTITSAGKPAAYASVRVCAYTGGGIPCSPLSSLYSDLALSQSVPNPYTTDGYGNFSFFVTAGAAYILQINVGGSTVYSYLVTSAGTGSGTVTSVGLTMPSIFLCTGSPVTGSGTIACSFNTQAPNLVFAGPVSGSAAIPGFRSLVVADFPFTYSGNTTELATVSGSITSGHCAQWLTGGNLGDAGAPCGSGSGGVASITATSPILASTPTGAVTISHAVSGITAGTYQQPRVTFDTYGHATSAQNGTLATVTYGTSVAYNLATATNFSLTLTGNVTSASTSNIEPGVVYGFFFQQDATGGRTITWPSTIKTATAINLAANGRTICYFTAMSDGNLYPNGVCSWY